MADPIFFPCGNNILYATVFNHLVGEGLGLSTHTNHIHHYLHAFCGIFHRIKISDVSRNYL